MTLHDKQTATPRQVLTCSSESPEPSTYCTFELGHEGLCSWERPHQSSVPDAEFDRPQTAEELFDLAGLASHILGAVSDHLLHDDSGAWDLVHKHRCAIIDARQWILDAKWSGVPEWQKRGAA